MTALGSPSSPTFEQALVLENNPMCTSKAGWLVRASGWASLGLLVGCQLVACGDDDPTPQSTAGSAGASPQGGGGGAAGVGGGGQGGVSGQAGGAGGLPRPEPTLLAAGEQHTCVRDQGLARCWGGNQYGQLGNSTNNDTDTPNLTPTLIDSAVLTGVLQPALGAIHSCALRDDGRVLCWGHNYSGQLGSSTNNNTDKATPVPALVDDTALGVVKQLALGNSHTCALRDDGRVLCWGLNYFGELGRSTNNNSFDPNSVPAVVDPTSLGVVKQVALGKNHSCALRDDGRVLCWGVNEYGQLGTSANSDTTDPNPVPVLVDHPDLGVVKQLALGGEHSCALRDDGRVLCWGSNVSGQLGSSANSGTLAPTPVPVLVDHPDLGVVTQLALGNSHSCALRDDGRVLCWGSNRHGELGSSANVGNDDPTPVPTLVDDGALGVVTQLALGYHHSCALRDDGLVLCWGVNDYGQLGNRANLGTDNPNPVPALAEGLLPLAP
jgi:alpha-tubulin suppressor-like RCC1 family protein